MSTGGGGRALAQLLSEERRAMSRGFCPARARWGVAPSRPTAPRGLRGRGADGLCLSLFLEVLGLLVRAEEGLLLECRISRTRRLL